MELRIRNGNNGDDGLQLRPLVAAFVADWDWRSRFSMAMGHQAMERNER